jgi:flagellar hook-basal body complex protein FliE
MSLPIGAITIPTPVTATTATSSAQSASSASGASFGGALNKMIDTVDASTSAANTAVANMIGGTGDVHEAMIALQRAQMTLELTIQVRNKFVQAYQDIMRMPV